MKLKIAIYYLLLVLLPTQLGRHFFFNFSTISGIRSDYLSPTLFLTDILALIILGWQIYEALVTNWRQWKSQLKKRINCNKLFFALFCFIIVFLLYNSLVIATNKFAAFYKIIKIFELVLLGWALSRLKPKIIPSILLLSVGLFYSSIIAVWQFILQGSVGGLLWFLGERTFNLTTPGIAKISLFGKMFLRPYATFSHPNVLGGFLATLLPLILLILLQEKKNLKKIYRSWLLLVFIIGLTVLILTFSRAAFLVATIGMWFALFAVKGYFHHLKRYISILLASGFLLIALSLLVPFLLPQQDLSFRERAVFIKTSFEMLAKKPVLGFGLNNFIVHFKEFSPILNSIFIFQPVHNIYLLVLVETGVVGFIFFLYIFSKIYQRGAVSNTLLFIGLSQLFFLGLFDHYLFTIQQAQLLFVIFSSLAFGKTNS